jgi:mRNA export factor
LLLKVLCSAWKDDGTTVFSGGCDKQAKMWPLLSGGQPTTVAMHDAPIKEIAWIPEMNLLATGSWDKTLKYVYWFFLFSYSLRVLGSLY